LIGRRPNALRAGMASCLRQRGALIKQRDTRTTHGSSQRRAPHEAPAVAASERRTVPQYTT
jgi:hypothetical protein